MFTLPKQPERPVVLVGSIGYLATPPASEVQPPPLSTPSAMRRRRDKHRLNKLPVAFIKGGDEVNELACKREFTRPNEKAIKHLRCCGIRLSTIEIVSMGTLGDIDYGMGTVLIIPVSLAICFLKFVPSQSVPSVMG